MTGGDDTALTLFMFPGACSRVTMSALEEVGLVYDDRLINTRTGEQNSPAYLAVNAKGKVPTLRVGERIMTENAAILWFLHSQHADARLLPSGTDEVTGNQGLIDLVWCSSTLHPMVRQIRNPARMTKGETAGVRDDGIDKFARECRLFTERVSGGRWWYGADWSVVDVYILWLCGAAEKGGFPLHDYPDLIDHAARVRNRPCVARAFDREAAAAARHKADLPADFAL